jgi:hypothetical protein
MPRVAEVSEGEAVMNPEGEDHHELPRKRDDYTRTHQRLDLEASRAGDSRRFLIMGRLRL